MSYVSQGHTYIASANKLLIKSITQEFLPSFFFYINLLVSAGSTKQRTFSSCLENIPDALPHVVLKNFIKRETKRNPPVGLPNVVKFAYKEKVCNYTNLVHCHTTRQLLTYKRYGEWFPFLFSPLQFYLATGFGASISITYQLCVLNRTIRHNFVLPEYTLQAFTAFTLLDRMRTLLIAIWMLSESNAFQIIYLPCCVHLICFCSPKSNTSG